MDDESTPAPLRGGAGPIELAREVLAVLEGQRGRAALGTVVGRNGSAPQAVGAKILLHEDGTLVGTVGGGAIEAQVIDACQHTLRDGKPRMVDAHLVRDLAMCCGGSMQVFVEHLQPQARLFLVGAGHVAQAVAPIARSADFRVTVFDDRDELLEHPAFAGSETGSYDVDELAAAIPTITDRDYVLVMTRDHARDEQALAHLMRRPHRYLGMIGSRRKVHAILRRILHREEQSGRPAPDLTRVRAPIGLALGGRTPAEIAVSIIAELIADRHGGHGAAMSVIEDASVVKGGSPDHEGGGPVTALPARGRAGGGPPSNQ